MALTLRPDVTLMDIAMPVMDGLQATEEIRNERPTACVLMLTGSNSRIDVDRAREAGAAGYVTKERIAAELIDAIVEVFASADTLAAWFSSWLCFRFSSASGSCADPAALGPRHRSRRHGLHACLAGWNAHRRAQPHATDRARRDPLRRQLRRTLPALQ